jgi:Methyltransferase domain
VTLHFDEYWIGPAQLAMTAALARASGSLNGEVIEVGTWQGLSAIPIARAIAPATLHVVDHWLGDAPEAGHYGIEKHRVERDNYGQFLANLDAAHVTNVEVHKMGWREFITDWDRPIRFLHIDASHTADEVDGNIKAFLPHAVSSAIFCGDDYGFPQVSEGVHRSFPHPHSSENKLWWQVVGDPLPGTAWQPHSHPLTMARSYMSDLSAAREMFVVPVQQALVNSGSNGTE